MLRGRFGFDAAPSECDSTTVLVETAVETLVGFG